MGFGGFHVLKGSGDFSTHHRITPQPGFRRQSRCWEVGEHLPISQHPGRLTPRCLGCAATTPFGEEKEHPPVPASPLPGAGAADGAADGNYPAPA